jgi:DNA-binding NarL/FixJ family response regulator
MGAEDQRASPGSTPTITALTGDFGSVMNRGLVQVLAEDPRIELVGDGIAAAALEQAVVGRAPDVAVLNGTTVVVRPLVCRVSRARPSARIGVLAHEPSRAYALSLLADGASACISRDASAAEILQAVHLAVEGKQLIACRAARDSAIEVSWAQTLTRREREVLAHLQADAMNAEIAALLNIGIETVRAHAANIYRKLGVRGRRDLVALAG